LEITVDIFRFLHFLGLGALLGGLLVQWNRTERRVNSTVIAGAVTQMVTGIVLLLLTLDTANHLKVTVKIVLLLGILIIVLVRRKNPLNSLYYYGILVLTAANTGIAVFW
jgi:hypothetical protein